MKAAFDTLQYVEVLEESGMPEAQAKASVKALSLVFDQFNNHLATKGDIEALKHEVRQLESRLAAGEVRLEERLGVLEAKLEEKLGILETKLSVEVAALSSKFSTLQWLVGGTFFGILTLVIKALFPLLGS